MADDDLDMLQELLELAEDDESHDKANLPETETSQQAPKSNGTGATAPTATARVNQSAVLRPLSRGKGCRTVAESSASKHQHSWLNF